MNAIEQATKLVPVPKSPRLVSLEVVAQHIPKGAYCYSHDTDGTKKLCPYWHGYRNGAVCELLQEVSMTHNEDLHLVWDQVKECNINQDHLGEAIASGE